MQLSWYTGSQNASNGASGSQTIKPSSSEPSGDLPIGSVDSGSRRSPDHMQEEEIVASGWGNDGDDGDGMGML